VLQARDGKPFVDAPAEVEEIAAIAAAIDAVSTPARASDQTGPERRWKDRARMEGLRDYNSPP